MVFPLSPVFIFFQLFIAITMVLMNSSFILLVLILYYHFVAQIVTDLTIGNPFTLASVSFCLVPIFTFCQHRLSLTTFLAQPWNHLILQGTLREAWSRYSLSFPPSNYFIHCIMISSLPSALLRSLLKQWVFLVLTLLFIRHLLCPRSDPLRKMVKKSCIISCSSCCCGTRFAWALKSITQV